MWHTPRCRHRTAVFRLERLEDRTVLSPLIVTSDADSGLGSLRDTIASAPSGSTIEFANNIARDHLTSGELDISQDLDIEGPGANKLTISGNDASRVFDISGGTTVTLAGLTIAHGLAFQGGGILIKPGADVAVTGCTLANNEALGDDTGGGTGGAIENLQGTLAVSGLQLHRQPGHLLACTGRCHRLFSGLGDGHQQHLLQQPGRWQRRRRGWPWRRDQFVRPRRSDNQRH